MKLKDVKLDEDYTFRVGQFLRNDGHEGKIALGIRVTEKQKTQSLHGVGTEYVQGRYLLADRHEAGNTRWISVNDLEGAWQETVEEQTRKASSIVLRQQQQELASECRTFLKQMGVEFHTSTYIHSDVIVSGLAGLTILRDQLAKLI